jgi:dipeptidyl aminopeptidase/acylaminoacyl peptidase
MRMHLPALFLALVLAAPSLSCGGAEAPGDGVARSPAQYSIEDFYRNTEYFGASFSPDARSLLVTSNQSGVFNVWTFPIDGGAPRQLTNSTTDAIFSRGYFPGDERILYSSDRGGNELTHVYVRDPDGRTTDLTPGETLKANFNGWAGDDRSLFISTNERDPMAFDLYEITADGYRRSLVYRNTENYELGPVSRDKRYLALVRRQTTNDADIYLHDRQTKTTRHITPHTGSVNHAPADFTPDSARLLFTSDSGREFTSLRSHDMATGAQATVYEEPWNVLFAQHSKSGRYLAVTVNEDSRFTVRLLDARTFRPAPLGEVPGGLLQGLRVSHDDSMVALYASDGSVPDDLFAGPIDGAKRRLTHALNPQMRREDLVVPSVVRFKSYDGLDIPGLLYKPHQASSENRVPALVMVHGGPGGQAVVGYSALTQALVNHGYAVFDINNRGSSGYGKTFFAMDDRKHGEADLGDVVASTQMLVDTGYVDPARIGIIGGSYGGYMVLAALTLRPDAFTAGVDLFGISNWQRTLDSMPAWWGAFRDALYAEMGNPKTDTERLRRISPLFNAERITAPLMVLQGANDPRVLKVESDEIVAAAKKNGVPVEYVVFADEGHGFVKRENEIRGYGAVLSFLERHLKRVPTPNRT